MVANSHGCCMQCEKLKGKACGEVQGCPNLCKYSFKLDVCARDSSPQTSHVRQKLGSNTFRSSTRFVNRTWYDTPASSVLLVSKFHPAGALQISLVSNNMSVFHLLLPWPRPGHEATWSIALYKQVYARRAIYRIGTYIALRAAV